MAMADADGDNATERIKIPPSLFIEHILAFALDDHQWALVIEEDSGIQKLATQTQHLFRGGPTVRLGLIIEWRESRCLHHFVLQTLPSSFSKLELVATRAVSLSSALVSAC